ncbi:MAG TPA: acyl-ACP--UDP-N-acetylglucosamine O-acyltransferase [Rhizomicrobium sp.]|nr:acyl-ACP--UDP-N-acetylglucosamine O-acyltransferase [Rhizomicrobium sp.]
MAVHPTAIVEDGARLGAGVEVGPFCIVGRDVALGDGVRLLSHAVVSGKTSIGTGTVIHPHAVIGGEAQIHNNNAPDARLDVGAHNVFREGVTISLGSAKGHNLTKIGDNNYLMAGSHIGHDCVVGNNVTLANGVVIGGHFEIGDGVIMGGLAAAQQFGRVGRYAFISGLSGISTDVIPYGIAIGLHVRLGGLNIIGLRRRKIPRPNIHALRHAYRAIFIDGKGSIQDNAREVEASGKWKGMTEVEEVLAFILADAKRSITPARKRGEDDEGED